MNTKEIMERIAEMDKASDEFFEIFSAVNEKYFQFDKPDKYQTAAMTLNLILHKGDEWMVELLASLGDQLFGVVEQNLSAVSGVFQVKDKTIVFDFYTDKDKLASLHKMLRNTVVVEAEKQVTNKT